MKTEILNLLDFEKVDILLEGFNKTTGFVTAILDLEGNVLSKSGWRSICTQFHRVNALTAKKCTTSDTELANKMAKGEKYHFYKCLNGLVDVAVPLVINGEHIANLFSGQFFFEEPDRDVFLKQAEKYGFDNQKYMKALADVPVFSEDRVKVAMDFLLNMTEMIADMTMQRVEQINLNKEIQEKQLQLKAQNEELHEAKEKTEESEKYNRMLFEQSAIGLALTSFEGKLVDINTTFANIIGRTVEEAKALTYWDITPEKYQDQEQQQLDLIAKTGRYGPYEKEYIHKDGHLVPVRLQGLTIERNNEKFVWSSIEDITERKRASEELERFFNLVPTLVCIASMDGYFNRVNDVWETTLGFTKAELLNEPFENFIHPDDIQPTRVEVARQISGNSTINFTNRYRTKSGTYRWLEWYATPAIDGSTLYAAALDITERKLAEDELRGREEKFKAVAEVSPLAIYSSSGSNQTAQYMNPTFHTMFGYSWDDVPTVGEWWKKAFPDEKYRANVMADWQNEIDLANKNHTDVKPYECVCTCKDGSEKIITWTARNVGDEFWTFGHDLTERVKSEKALKESEEKFRNIFENSPIGKSMTGIDGSLQVNQAFCDMLGYTKSELANKHWPDISHKDDEQQSNDVISDLLAGKREKGRFEKRYFHKNGDIIYTDVSTFLQRSAESNPLYFITSVNDITERKHAEISLKHSKEYAESLIQTANVIVIGLNAEGEIVVMNEAAEQITGYTFAELKGGSWFETLVPKDKYPEVWESFLNYSSTGEGMKTFENPILTKSGTERYVSWQNGVLHEDDQITGTISFGIDITEKRQAEKELRESEEQLKKLNEELEQRILDRTKELTDLYDNAPCGYHSLNEDGLIIHINETELNMLGYTKEEVLNRMKISDLMTPESKEKFKINFPLFKEMGFLKDIEFDFIRKDRSILSILLSATAVYDSENNYLMSRSTLIDNTDLKHATYEIQKAKATLEASNKELEAFSYSVSHDLRAPLRHINGYVNLINDRFKDEMPEKARYYLETVTNSAMQMGTLIDDLLQFSRTGRQEVQKTTINMNVMINEVLDKIKQDTENRNISWSIQNLPEVFGDYALLKQVWVNLLDNAVKYTRNETIAEISIECIENKENFVFSVRDNGVGFDMKYVHKLFGVFQRLHSQSEFEGTGIGLANVQRIIHKHSGKVWAEAKPGEGATFLFSLPKI